MGVWVFDSEVYKNLYLIAFMNKKGDVRSYRAPLTLEQKKEIVGMLKNDTIIGFNSLNYDLPILSLALKNTSQREIKKASDRIIQNNLKWWQAGSLPQCKDHIDLIEVAPGKASLKIYGGRLNSKRMQSLPIHFDKELSEQEKDLIEKYCINDLSVTALLASNLREQLKIRRVMSKQYGIDLMSKSDAQIAEAVIKSELKLDSDDKRVVEPGHSFKYKPPKWMRFKTEQMQQAFTEIQVTDFIVKDSGKVALPDAIKYVNVYGKKYKMGIGGLHSTESKASHYTDDKNQLSDHDVASYYPSIILNEKLYPEHLGERFLEVYRNIVERRLAAKANGEKTVADTLKIVINGSFGKFGSKYSVLFAPEMLIQVTLTGQLALLMLIEMFEDVGIPVVSANTDGVVILCPLDKTHLRDEAITWWEKITGFTTEETFYKSLHSRDVNNYIAVKKEGAKGKGCFAMPGMSKNAQNVITYEAVIKYIAYGDTIEDTVKQCQDITKFCSIRTVKGGALSSEGEELGTAIRWYYSTESKGPITYQLNGNKVPKSDGSKPMMELPETLPNDIDYQWYIDEAESILKEIGYGV